MTNVKRLMLLSERIKMILEHTGPQGITQWENDFLIKLSCYDWGSPKQAAIVDGIGQRLGLDFTIEPD